MNANTNDTVIDVTIEVHNQQAPYGGLTLRQTAKINAADFATVARLMARFHDLFEQIRKENLR